MITFGGIQKVRTVTQTLKSRNTPQAMKELLLAELEERKKYTGQEDVNVFTKTRFTRKLARTDIYVATGEDGLFLNNILVSKINLFMYKIENVTNPEKTKLIEDRILALKNRAENLMIKYRMKPKR